MASYEINAQNGRIGALESWSRTKNRNARTQAARENSPGCFEYHLKRVDPAITDPQERVKAAEEAHRAHMLRMARASAKKRAQKAAESAA